jgi:lipid-A-disaccharide synthase
VAVAGHHDDKTRPEARAPRGTVAIVAGEASGDLLGASLVRALRGRFPDLEFEGIAGPRMQAEGVRSLFPMATLSVRGYVEAFANLRAILGIRRRLKQRLRATPPRLFIGIDAPDFNLNVERALKRAGVTTVHFIGPSIWAWRPERIHGIKRAVSHMLLVFPFEEAIYHRHGIPATYVGHPLAYALPETPDRDGARLRLGLDADAEYLALMPGSRDSELRQLARLYVRTMKLMHARRPETTFLVPMVNADHELYLEAMLKEEAATHLPLRFLQGRAHDVLQAADCGLIASGTATLEAMLLDCPHVITYKVPWLTFKLMKRRAVSTTVGLPNILAGRAIVPEMIQEQANPEALAEALLGLLADPAARAAMRAEFAPLRESLRRDTPREIVDALTPYLE